MVRYSIEIGQKEQDILKEIVLASNIHDSLLYE